MPSNRTTIVLGEKEPASRERARRARAKALDRAQDVFDTMDVAAEIARIREERDSW